MLVPEALQRLGEYVDAVNSELSGLYPSNGTTLLDKAVEDALSRGGKRVRATLALLWCEVYSGDYRPAVPLAVAYELAHASALVQDDIIDRSDRRRGQESIVAKYGLPNAILASDLLLFNVPKMVARYGYLDGGRLARIFDMVGEACRATTWGEFLDLEMARVARGSEEEYEEMIRLKTSTLLSAPCAGGAMVGGASDEQVSLAAAFGEALGMAYQVQDDTLDLVGSEASLGKPVLTDVRGGKLTVVLMHCMGRCSAADREFIVGLMNRAGEYSPEEVSRLRSLLESQGSIEYGREVVLRRTREARAVLDRVPEGSARALLVELTDYLATRDS